MKRSLTGSYLAFSVAIIAAVTVSLSAEGAPHPTPGPTAISVPRGVIVPVLVTEAIRVGGAGESNEVTKIEYAIAQDVIVNGYVILKAGDPVEGHYTDQRNITRRYFSTDVSQEVALDMDDAINFCGDTVHLTFERTFVGGARGGFLSFGVHAHDAVFDKGLILKASVDRFEKNICAEPTTETQAPLPADVVVPDDEVSPQP